MKKTILIAILAIFVSCSKDETYIPPADPKRAILGEWELIEKGNWSNMLPNEPSYYIEYLSDSLVGWYNYETEEYIVLPEKYWIDSLLHIGEIRYSYIFYENKVRLDFVDILAINNTFIYQRKKIK